jgi:hypothetical protein
VARILDRLEDTADDVSCHFYRVYQSNCPVGGGELWLRPNGDSSVEVECSSRCRAEEILRALGIDDLGCAVNMDRRRLRA